MEKLILERKGRVLVATIDDPAPRNPLYRAFSDGLPEAVAAASGDRSPGQPSPGPAGCPAPR